MDNDAVHLADDLDVDLDGAYQGCDLPDMVECNTSKVTSPVTCQTQAAQRGSDDVTQRLPQVETLVRELPDTIQTPHGVRLTYHVLPRHLV